MVEGLRTVVPCLPRLKADDADPRTFPVVPGVVCAEECYILPQDLHRRVHHPQLKDELPVVDVEGEADDPEVLQVGSRTGTSVVLEPRHGGSSWPPQRLVELLAGQRGPAVRLGARGQDTRSQGHGQRNSNFQLGMQSNLVRVRKFEFSYRKMEVRKSSKFANFFKQNFIQK